MPYSIACPPMENSIVRNIGEGDAVWGEAITPSIAHLVQSHRKLWIDYPRARPQTLFATETGAALLPHIVDGSRLRLHAEVIAFHRAAGQSGTTIEGVIRLPFDRECTLKLCGRVTLEEPLHRDLTDGRNDPPTIPAIFDLVFWEVSRTRNPNECQLVREALDNHPEVQRLRTQVALVMCSH